MSSDSVVLACRAMHTAGGPCRSRARRPHRRQCAPAPTRLDTLGVSPEYGASVRAMNARHTLRTSPSITDAIYDAGYGSVRAFYEKASARLGMTPSDFAAGAPTAVWSTSSRR